MKKNSINFLEFEVDKLTESVEHRLTGKSFATNISLVLLSDLKQLTKKKGWLFNWKAEVNILDREVYKLTLQDDSTGILGLVSLSMKPDHLYMDLIESASSNRGKNKVYLGVPGNLVAFACKLSFQRGFDGFLAFHSKTKLIEHYQKTLGAYHVGGRLMIIGNQQAKFLVNKYFKD